MDNSLKIQAQIRNNAEEVSSYLSDLAKWETAAKQKDLSIKQKTQIRKNIAISPMISPNIDSHHNMNSSSHDLLSNKTSLTPASIIGVDIPSVNQNLIIQPPRRQVSDKDAESSEREHGNAEYEKGNFNGAIKCYTRCLGLKVANYVAFSNRAMALLKLKEFHRAEADCDCALNIEPSHIKSLVRRATARNALGKHRASLQDLIQAEKLDPSNKMIRADLHKTRELLRAAVNRAPLVRILHDAHDSNVDDIQPIAGPDLSIPA